LISEKRHDLERVSLDILNFSDEKETVSEVVENEKGSSQANLVVVCNLETPFLSEGEIINLRHRITKNSGLFWLKPELQIVVKPH